MKKENIKQQLNLLIGYELTHTTRMGATECLKFGTLYKTDFKGIERLIGNFALHLQCAWRFTKNDVILVGDLDLYEQPNEMADFDMNFDWDIQQGNLRDVKLKSLLQSEKLIVKSVENDSFGGFEINFNEDFKLTAFPTLSSKSQYSEHWRLLDNRKEDNEHFIAGPMEL